MDLNEVKALNAPACPPRACTPGESIYLELWHEYLYVAPAFIDKILSDIPFETTQRDRAVAASFMVFMGCNAGQAFTESAEDIARNDGDPYGFEVNAYFAAWVRFNRRYRSTNYGVRAIEFMLAPVHPVVHDRFGARLDRSLIPEISMRDIDVVEAMVAWWASPDAKEIRGKAKERLDELKRIKAYEASEAISSSARRNQTLVL